MTVDGKSSRKASDSQAIEKGVSTGARALVLGSFLASYATTAISQLVTVVAKTRAIPPQEFPPARIFFQIYPTVQWLHRILLALFLVSIGTHLFVSLFFNDPHEKNAFRNGTREKGRGWDIRKLSYLVFLLLAGAFQVGALYKREFLLAATVSFFFWYLAEQTAILDKRNTFESLDVSVSTLENIRLRSLFSSAGEIIGLPALGLLLAVFLELIIFTRPFCPELFTLKDYYLFGGTALSGAILAGGRFGLELLLFFLLARQLARKDDLDHESLVSKWVQPKLLLLSLLAVSLVTASTWNPWEVAVVVVGIWCAGQWFRFLPHRASRLPAISFVTGLYVWARSKDFLFSTLSSEMSALNMAWWTHAFFALTGTLVAIWTHHGLKTQLKRAPAQSGFNLTRAMVISATGPLTPLIGWIQERFTGERNRIDPKRPSLWPMHLGSLVACAVMLLLFFELNYPQFTDLAELLTRLFSMLLTLVVILFLLGLYSWVGGRFLRSRKIALAVLAIFCLAGGIFWATHSRKVPRMIGHQYSKIAQQSLAFGRLSSPTPSYSLEAPKNPSTSKTPDSPFLSHSKRFPPLSDLPQTAYYQKRRPLILFIVWDAVRPDHMSLYGYPRPTTPWAQILAKDSVVFTNAMANATATTASLRHLFTGRYSSRYMLSKKHNPHFTGELVELGYRKIFVNIFGSDFNGVSREAFVRNQSSGKNPTPTELTSAVNKATIAFADYYEAPKFKRVERILDLEMRRQRKTVHPSDGVFVYIHCIATHHPWKNHPNHPIYGHTLVDKYDNSIGHVDAHTGQLIKFLKKRGIYDDTVIVLTADHGTGLGEHGKYGGFQPYQEQIRVPLVIKAPGFSPRTVHTPVAGIDMAPTLLSLFRPGVPNPYDGHSLVELMAGTAHTLSRRYLLSLASFEDAVAVIDLQRHIKLHVHRSEGYEMLFDLRKDPGEKRNLADTKPKLLRALLTPLARFMQLRRSTVGNPYHYRPFP